MDYHPHDQRNFIRWIDPDPQRTLKWLPIVLVFQGSGFCIGLLLGDPRLGLYLACGPAGLFIAWREEIAERRAEERSETATREREAQERRAVRERREHGRIPRLEWETKDTRVQELLDGTVRPQRAQSDQDTSERPYR
ncbi:MAG TPA: hypothetical protein VLP43_03485 [Solirubrobacteraceae bacterium]|nr:hypothetical protein [Solirubrobacteraceae bacterium]